MLTIKYSAVLLLVLLAGCAHQSPGILSSPHGTETAPPTALQQIETQPECAATDAQPGEQMLLDAAIEAYQASNEHWQQGDLERAIASLDSAYDLILKVGDTAGQVLAQQKEDLRITIARRIIEVYASRIHTVNGYSNAIPLVTNVHVEQALQSFKTREKRFFIDAYKRSGRYRPAILEALREEGLPEELSWLPLIESGYKVRALSKARALGMWQFIASTGYKFGLERNAWVDERMDPEKSTRAAIAYLKELHGIFGDWSTVLAAYNCGEGAVLRVIRRQNVGYLDDFWDLYTRLPRETASYVPRFLAVLHIMNDPVKHGFDLPEPDSPLEFENVTINKQAHLDRIARSLNIPASDLKYLNPELRNQVTPHEPYSLKVPPGQAERLLSMLDEIQIYVPPVPAYVVHKVRNGESLSVIAQRYKTTVKAIKTMNNLANPAMIRTGAKLKIPTGSGGSYRAAQAPSRTARGSENLHEYIVQKGDSLWDIANRHGTTVRAIKTLNQLPSTRLSIGQVLLVPRKAPQA